MTQTMNRTRILATGMFVPANAVTNDDLARKIDTNHQWIVERTGIHQRHISNPEGGEWPTDMATKASLQAIEAAGLEPNDIDLIIFGTCTPDVKLPNCGSILQTKLGITNQCGAFDLQAACSGFVYGMNMADSLIKTGAHKNILVVGAETTSREINWDDRGICILFGDGAGVAVVSAAKDDESSEILATHLSADGTGREFFEQSVGGVAEPVTQERIENKEHFFQMRGKEMFKIATRTLAENARICCRKAGIELEEIKWMVPHQANIRIIETTGKLLGIDPEKVIVNIDKYANTSAATVPMAFHEAIQDGRIKRGDIVLFDAFGAGVTSGATLLRY